MKGRSYSRGVFRFGGVAMKFRLGGWIPTGGRIQVSINHLTPNSKFFSDFGHFIMKMLNDLKILANLYQEFFVKKRDFWGISPTISNWGDVHPYPPGDDAHFEVR